MKNRPPITHLLAISLALAGLAAGAWFYTNAADPVEGIPDVTIGELLSSEGAPAGRASCEESGGVWNECASACPPDAEACILMCVQKCEGLGDGKKVVEIYFPNAKLDPEHLDCSKVFPVRRAVDTTQDGPDAVEYRILNALLAGPTDAEKSDGYFSSIPEGVTAVREWHDATFEVEFSEALSKVAGSCRVLSIRSQVETTVKAAFPDVKKVEIAVEGRSPEESLQP